MDFLSPFGKSLYDENLIDLSIDYADIGIDKIVDNDFVKDIPIIKTICALVSTSINIRERFLIKKYLVFLKAFNENRADASSIAKRVEALNNKETWVTKEIEYLIIFLDRNDSIKKSELIAILYSQYLNKKIDYNKFTQLIEIVDKLLIYDLSYIKEIYTYCYIDKNKGYAYDLASFNRLEGLGLILKHFNFGEERETKKEMFINEYVYRFTYLGKVLGEIIFQKS